jgi:fatty acid desaturase
MVVSEGRRWVTREALPAGGPGARAAAGEAQEYVELKKRIRAAGLMERQPRFYALTFVLALTLAGGAIALMALAPGWPATLAGCVLLTLAFGQLAFLGHDGGHRQIFIATRQSRRFLLLMTLLLGVSLSWWTEKHNRHHSFPNALGVDPDIDLPVLAFSQEDAAGRSGIWRWFVRYQGYLIVPILALEGIGLRVASAQYLWRQRTPRAAAEAGLSVVHLAAYVAVLVWLLGPWAAAAFGLAHHLLTGMYLGSIFAPNHKGMELIERDAPVSFLRRQVLTSRNLSSHPVIDWLYGGQNFQIEHHLFPSMPRNNLRRARTIVKDFLAERGLPYAETTVLGSYREIISHLREVSRVLERPQPA